MSRCHMNSCMVHAVHPGTAGQRSPLTFQKPSSYGAPPMHAQAIILHGYIDKINTHKWLRSSLDHIVGQWEPTFSCCLMKTGKRG